MTQLRILIFSICLLALSTTAAELKLASPFTDHMVLQRDTAVTVWGKAKPGSQVTVQFAGQTQSTQTDTSGKWMLSLTPLTGTKKGSDLITTSDAASITLKDVVVGEVWICSGQSNMYYPRTGVKELDGLSDKGIRTFTVKQNVAFTEQDELQGKWQITGPDSAVGFGFAHYFAKHIDGDFPVGIIMASWGSSAIEAWMPRDMTEDLPYFKTIMAELDANTEAQKQIKAALAKEKWSRQEDIFLRRQINIVYNAMIHPLIPYTCRGLVWYQGERNERYISGMPKSPWFHRVGSIEDYDDTLKAWIQRYRKAWSNDAMQFYIVMLPGYGNILATSPTKDPNHPTAHSRAWMRESQLKSLQLSNTAVVNTIDLGDAKNNHPKDKEPIGKRLALFAAKDILGKEIQAMGPTFEQLIIEGNQAIVQFNHATDLKTTDGKAPREFWVADSAGNWSPASATIRNGNQVVLSSPDCPTPKQVRYAFTGMPKVNLINSAKLPAYPFRTDQFKP